MPRGDRTGPMGMGPMTGRGAGYCAGYDMPGYANPIGGRGYGAGGGRGYGAGYGGGRGRGWGGGGWGWRNQYYATGMPGWARYGGYAPAWSAPQPTQEQEGEYLKQQAELLKSQLDEINKRIEELGKTE